MSYPPPYNNDNGQYPPPSRYPSQYPSQYLQQIPQNAAQQRPSAPVAQSQPQYNSGGANVQYMNNYTNSFAYPQASIPSYVPTYGQPSPSQPSPNQRGQIPSFPQSPQQQYLYSQQRHQQYATPGIQQHQYLQQHLSHPSPQLPPPPQQSPQHLNQLLQPQQQYGSPVVQQLQQKPLSHPSPQTPSQPSPRSNQLIQPQQQYSSQVVQQLQQKPFSHPSPRTPSQPSPQLNQQLQQHLSHISPQPLPQPLPQSNQNQQLQQQQQYGSPAIQQRRQLSVSHPSPRPPPQPSPRQNQPPPPQQQQQQPPPPPQQLGSQVVQQQQKPQEQQQQNLLRSSPKVQAEPLPRQSQKHHQQQVDVPQPVLQAAPRPVPQPAPQIAQEDPPMLFVNPSDTFTEPVRKSFTYDVGPSSTPLSSHQHGSSFTTPIAAPQPSTLPSFTTPTPAISNPTSHQSSTNKSQGSQEQYRKSSSGTGLAIPPSNESTTTPSRQTSQDRKVSVQSASPFTKTPQVVIPPISSLKNIPTSKSPMAAPQKIQKPQKPAPAKDVDYQTLLLALADEYLNAAHSKGTVLALSKDEADLREYYKLVATGLGCLEAAQSNFRLPPLTEALTRLRYARILIEETDNDVSAETALSKGIEICERNKLLDLKYTMQQLLARMLHKSNPKAAAKTVDKMIQEVETYQHVPWEYAFRFLRVSLALSSTSHQDFVVAIHNLQKLSNLGNRNGDKLVAVIASLIEALAHLQQSTSTDSVEQAQHAVAAARSHQLDPRVQEIPQIGSMLQMIDISCNLLEYDLNHASQKLQIMQKMMDQRINDSHWRDDGSFLIPLSIQTPAKGAEMGDILKFKDGKLHLTFHWLPQHDLYALCYFLSSMTLSAKNSHDGRKAEKYLQEGLRMVRGNFKSPQEITESVVAANKRLEWRRVLYCNILLHLTFLACARTDWETASQTLKDLQSVADDLAHALPETISCLMQYASGVIAQGTGDLAAALAAFDSPLLSLSSTTNRTMRNDPRRDTAILAGLNTILILRDPSHHSHSRLDQVLALVEPQCLSSSNRYIQAAYYLVCSTVHTESTIQTKQYLQQALQSATAISNSQITCMTLTFMSWKYFRGVVGEQSEKSARAGRAMAKKANDRLWVSVTDQMLAETLDRQGKADEARSVREEADRLLMGLPAALKRTEY